MTLSSDFFPKDHDLRSYYEIPEKLVAQGGFGRIFKITGKFPHRDGDYALKKIVPQKGQSPTEVRRRVERECLIINLLSNNCPDIRIPHPIPDFSIQEYYLVMPWINGEILSNTYEEGDSFIERGIICQSPGNNSQQRDVSIINFLKDILETLEYIHEEQYIHRDIKPPNIMRVQQGTQFQFIIIDFGIAYTERTDYCRYNERSPNNDSKSRWLMRDNYMALENSQGNPVYASDIYSVGAIAIRWLTGTALSTLKIGSKNLQEAWNKYKGDHKNQVHEKLGDILSKMVAENVGDRYQSCDEVVTALNGITIEEQRIKGSLDSWTGISDYYSYFIENSSPPTN